MANPNSVPKSTWKLDSVEVKEKYWTQGFGNVYCRNRHANEVLSIGRARHRRKQPCHNESERSNSEERETTDHISNLLLLLPEQGIFQDTFLNPPNHPPIPTSVTTWDISDIGSGSD
ncbi:unnamed protein product [Allacma fusca]|uniref:Uncharacterized protein n=1 Tax=Allacma fusca TaxID=39272 RepID=A0A8J2IYZ1_9HEXA|nr:unnamed protein product [Allacma fusca]